MQILFLKRYERVFRKFSKISFSPFNHCFIYKTGSNPIPYKIYYFFLK